MGRVVDIDYIDLIESILKLEKQCRLKNGPQSILAPILQNMGRQREDTGR